MLIAWNEIWEVFRRVEEIEGENYIVSTLGNAKLRDRLDYRLISEEQMYNIINKKMKMYTNNTIDFILLEIEKFKNGERLDLFL